MLYFLTFLVRKKIFHLESQLSTLLLMNQYILMFKSGSVIIMSLWKIYLEARTLVLVCVEITPSLNIMKRVLLMDTPTRRDTKDLHISLILMK